MFYRVALLVALTSLLGLVETIDEVELDKMKWKQVYRLIISEKNGPQEADELIPLIRYLVKRSRYEDAGIRIIREYAEASEISEWRCHRGFFKNLGMLISYNLVYGSHKVMRLLVEIEKRQFNACRDLLAADLMVAKDRLDKDTQSKAMQFLRSFKVEPLPFPTQYFSSNYSELTKNLVEGTLVYLESQSSGPIKSKGIFGRDMKTDFMKKFNQLVNNLCDKIIEELELDLKVYEKLFNSEELIIEIRPEALKWIQIEGICEFAKHQYTFKNLAEKIFSKVACRDFKKTRKYYNTPIRFSHTSGPKIGSIGSLAFQAGCFF